MKGIGRHGTPRLLTISPFENTGMLYEKKAVDFAPSSVSDYHLRLLDHSSLGFTTGEMCVQGNANSESVMGFPSLDSGNKIHQCNGVYNALPLM